MRTVVVEDQMDVKLWRHLRIDLIKELTKLHRAMAAMQLANDFTRLSVQRGEQRSRAVAFVIMCSALSLARAQGQNGLRPIQRLNLRFLIHTQHQSFIWRVQVKSY